MVFVGSTGNTVSTTTGLSSRMVTFTRPDLVSPAKPTAASARAAHAPRQRRATGKRELCCMGSPILALVRRTERRLAVRHRLPCPVGRRKQKGIGNCRERTQKTQTGWSRELHSFASLVFFGG